MQVRVGADIGGTFTDVVVMDEDGRLTFGKTLTVPEKPAVAVVRALDQALRKAGTPPSCVDRVIHGTTLVANALIERKTARTALVTTAGFRDLIEIGTEYRYDAYDLFMRRTPPLVPRHLRFGVDERITADGRVARPLDPGSVADVASRCAAEQVESVAIAFLHSYLNDRHERDARDLISKRLPGVSVSVSSEVDPQIREYPRISTTIANACVQPLVAEYLRDLQAQLVDLGISAPLLVFSSEGGTCSVETARKYPVRILESGPIGGVTAARTHGERIGWPDLLAFDMGGTTAKVSLTSQGETLTTHEFEVAPTHKLKRGSGLPVRAPVIDMIEIGAGGGSIARVNRLGLLSVGPQSAGADPGPVCYRRGGTEPTVTDADLVLGLLDAERFLGGRMRLDIDAAHAAIEEKVAGPLGMTVPEAAWSIHTIANEHMANAARVHATERGKALHDFRLFASGGAGPVHACALARALGVRDVFVPRGAGVASAFGFLCAPLSFSAVRTLQEELTECSQETVMEMLEAMAKEARALIGPLSENPTRIAEDVLCDMRYVGQIHELTVRVAGRPDLEHAGVSLGHLARKAFLASYRERYGEASESMPIEILNWRLQVRDATPTLATPPANTAGGGRTPRPDGKRTIYRDNQGTLEKLPVEVFEHASLSPGHVVAGPAIIQQEESTFYVDMGFRAHIDEALCISAHTEEQAP